MRARTRLSTVLSALLVSVVFATGPVSAANPPDYQEDFSAGLGDWAGAIVHNAGPETGTVSGSAYTVFGGYSSIWPGDYVAEVSVYLDPAWPIGTGFDYTVASSNQAGAHLRDFIFHIGVTAANGLRVYGDNNTYGGVNDFILNQPGSVPITTAGWYTLQHVLRDNGGVLAVDLNLLDSANAVVYTTTRSNAGDLIASVVGGNRYGWFAFTRPVGYGIEIDNVSLCPVGGCSTPKGDKEAVLAALVDLRDNGGFDAKTVKRIQKAIDRLEKSLTPTWWLDDDTLAAKDGKRVFDEEKKVVKELSKKELAGNPTAQALIQVILDVDRALAETAITDAAGGSANELAKANDELAKGDADRLNGKPGHAIDHWKKAWEHAQKA